jgi:AraC family transcriptional regulator
VAIAVRCLDDALRIWNEDHAQAKSQIKVAAAMLRSDIDVPRVREKLKPTGGVVRALLPWQAGKVQEFIDGSLNAKIRAQNCASRLRLSNGHFSRAFKASFGTTVVNYIHRCRIERAQQLMLVSKQPLYQIAFACGFADQPHYCRVFRAVVGLNPNAWRRQKMTEVSA